MLRGRPTLFLFATVVACLIVSETALAQPEGGYPPPTPAPGRSPCAQTGTVGKNSDLKQNNAFSPGDAMAVRGKNRCAKANARVRVAIDDEGSSKTVGIGSSDERGAYLVGGRVPRSTSFGTHKIIVKTKSHRYETTIEVVAPRSSRETGFDAAGPLLVAWVALVGLIGAFFVGARRRKHRAAAVATSTSDVPRIDTSAFVPNVSTRDKRTALLPTEPAKPSTPRKNTPRNAGRSRGSNNAKAKPAPRAPKQHRKDADGPQPDTGNEPQE